MCSHMKNVQMLIGFFGMYTLAYLKVATVRQNDRQVG